MIDRDYARLMGHYNRWRNQETVRQADRLSHAERWEDRGAFFGSIARTLNHILWDDRRWLAHFAQDRAALAAIGGDTAAHPVDWAEFKSERAATDAALLVWIDGLTAADLHGDVNWHVGQPTRPRWVCLVHLFNHQTHHRGQVHAMLTAAGVETGPTDLVVLPTFMTGAEAQ